MTYIIIKRVLIAADDALKSALESGDKISEETDKKFGDAIDLLSAFEEDFPSKDPTPDDLDPNIGGTTTRDAKMSKSPLTILHALKENLHSKVNFHSFLFLSPLIVDKS